MNVSVAPPLPARARSECGPILLRSRGSRFGKLFLISPLRKTSALISPLKLDASSTLRAPLARRISAPSPCQPRVGTVTLTRSEEHTSELQSQSNLVCRLLLEKKKTN